MIDSTRVLDSQWPSHDGTSLADCISKIKARPLRWTPSLHDPFVADLFVAGGRMTGRQPWRETERDSYWKRRRFQRYPPIPESLSFNTASDSWFPRRYGVCPLLHWHSRRARMFPCIDPGLTLPYDIQGSIQHQCANQMKGDLSGYRERSHCAPHECEEPSK